MRGKCQWRSVEVSLKRESSLDSTGSITHSLKSDMPDDVVSDHANVNKRVIEVHYDRPTEREKLEQRREYRDNI